MTIIRTQEDILQPNSWEYIVAREAKLSPEEFSSSQPTSIQQQIAHAFIDSVRKKPTKYGIEEFSRCLDVDNTRQERLQDNLQKEFEEVEQEESDRYAEYNRILFSITAKQNTLLSNINSFKAQLEYYNSLLPDAQKYAKATKDIFDKLPKDLPADALRSRFIEKLHKKAVIYTTQKVVDAITRGIKYYGLMIDLYMAEAKEKNEKLLFGEYLEDYEIPNFNPIIYEDFMQSCPSDLIAFDLAELNFSKQEAHLVEAWASLGEDFSIPSLLNKQELPKSDIKTFKVEPLANAKQAQTTVVSAEPVAKTTQTPIPVETSTDSSQRPIPSDLPILTELSPLSTVCKFLHRYTGDIAFATVPQTSKEVKAFFDKLFTPAISQLYKRLDARQKLSYKFARECLADSLKKFESAEVEAEEKQELSKIALGHRV